jgi:AraC-like DNA-binding protein
MYDHLADPFSLSEMARTACISPFHFDRIFHDITGIPAVQFLYALRIEAAKRLLLTTSLSVTDVCYEVGYNSIGTFTSRFTQLVGLSPRHFRQLARRVDNSLPESSFNEVAALLKKGSFGQSVNGRIITPDPVQRLIFVGLFPTLIPQSRPLAGTLITGSDSYVIGPVRDGRYNVFAAGFPKSDRPQAYLLPDAASLLVGVGQHAANLRDGRSDDSVNVMLRPLRITDPPILIALPFLLVEVLRNAESMVV